MAGGERRVGATEQRKERKKKRFTVGLRNEGRRKQFFYFLLFQCGDPTINRSVNNWKQFHVIEGEEKHNLLYSRTASGYLLLCPYILRTSSFKINSKCPQFVKQIFTFIITDFIGSNLFLQK